MENSFFPPDKIRLFMKRCLFSFVSMRFAPRKKHQTRILVYGDSNSNRRGIDSKSWPSLLQNNNRAYLRIINESRDGRTVGRDTGQYNGLTDIRCRLDAYKSIIDWIVVMLGTNDLKSEYGSPEPTLIKKDMAKLLDIIESYDGTIKPVLLTPPPMGVMNRGHLAGAHVRVKHLASEYRDLALKRGTPFIDIYSLLDTASDLEPDMIHINATGRQKIANAVWSDLSLRLAFQSPAPLNNPCLRSDEQSQNLNCC